MRRILAILIILVIAVMAVLIIWDVPRNMLLNFATTVAGPTIVNTGVGAVSGIITHVGLAGFAGLLLIGGLISGILVHTLWVKTDWRLRRWGSQRISRDLGAQPTTNLPATPVGATVRPPVKTQPKTQTKPTPPPEPPVVVEETEA